MRKDKLKILLEDSLKSVSKAELAKRLKLPTASLHNYLYTDTDPTIKSLESIADYYKIGVAYFFDEEGVVSSPSPCTASPICQEICKICESLPDNEKTKILEYTEFIKEQYNNKRGGRVGGIKGGEE